jgi:hypothetical protein
LSAPLATIINASSGNGRCSAFASSHGARIHASRSSSVVRITGIAFGWIGSMTAFGDVVRNPKTRCGPGIGFDLVPLDAMLQALGLKVVLIEDAVSTARTLVLRTPVQSNQQRFGNVSRLTPKLLPPPSQPASSPILTVVSGKRRGKYA